MTRFRKLLASGHIQVALATGLCIVGLAFVSKRLMANPIPDLYLALPPFLMALYEGIQNERRPHTWYHRATVWIALIVGATVALIFVTWS